MSDGLVGQISELGPGAIQSSVSLQPEWKDLIAAQPEPLCSGCSGI